MADPTADPVVTVSRQIAVFTYDLAGRLVTEEDAEGRAIQTTYDQADRATKRELLGFVNRDATTRDVELERLEYDNAGNMTMRTAGTGGANALVSEMGYDAAGRLFETVADPLGKARTTTLTLNAAGLPELIDVSEGARSETTTMVYDSSDRLVETRTETGSGQIVTELGYDQRSNVVSSVDGNGAETVSVYDEAGRLSTVTAPPVPLDGTTTMVSPVSSFGYNAFGDQTVTEDAEGNITTVGYDRLGRAVLITHPTYTNPDTGAVVTPTESFGYDAVGNKTSETSRRGETTTFVFDSQNRPVKQTDPAASDGLGGTRPAGVVTFAYDKVGNATETVDQRGAVTSFTYDMLNRVRTETAHVRRPGTDDAYTSVYDYDDLGNQTVMISAEGHETLTSYSPFSEVATVTDAIGEVTSFEYVLGRVTKTVDPLGRYTTNTYDLAGRQTDSQSYSATGTELSHTRMGYDPAGNLAAVVSPRGFEAGNSEADYTTTYDYDALGRLASVTEPVDATTSLTSEFGYDGVGNQTRLVDGNGNDTSYTFNPWNLREDIVEPSTPGQTALADRTFTTGYDPGGLPTAELMPGGVRLDRSFDELGRLRSVDGTGDGPAVSKSFDYDAAGMQTEVSHPAGDLSYVYDDRGLLETVAGGAGAASYTYDGDGRLVQRVDSAGTHGFSWTDRNELDTLTDGVSDVVFDYVWDAASQLDRWTSDTGLTRDYSFDGLGRLVGDSLTDAAATQVAGFSYAYDSELMTSKTVTLAANAQAGVHAYDYDRAGRLVEWDGPAGVVAYSWDGAGNRLGSGSDTYTYDDRNRLTSGPEGTYAYSPRGTLESLTDGGTVTDYGFDSFGRLTDFDGQVAYTYDGLDRVATRDAQAFSYEGFSLDPTSDGTFTYGRSPSGRLISQTDGANPLLAGLDAHGDLSFLFTAAGVVSDTAVYDPFGDPAAQTGSTSPTLGFQADFTDPVSEHVWMGARWYDGGWAAFLSRDTYFGELKTPISLNRYTYGHANPVRYFDPDGRAAEAAGGSGCTLSGCDYSGKTHVTGTESYEKKARYANNQANPAPATSTFGTEEVAQVNDGRGNQRHQTFPDGTPLPPDWSMLPNSTRIQLMNGHMAVMGGPDGRWYKDAGKGLVNGLAGVLDFGIDTAEFGVNVGQGFGWLRSGGYASGQGPDWVDFGMVGPVFTDCAGCVESYAVGYTGGAVAEAAGGLVGGARSLRTLLGGWDDMFRSAFDDAFRGIDSADELLPNNPTAWTPPATNTRGTLPAGESPYQLQLFPTEPYNRVGHYGYTPTTAQKAAVPAGMEFDHTPSLVEHYYLGPGDGSLPGFNLTQTERLSWAQGLSSGQAALPSVQRAQGGLAAFSVKMKRMWGIP